MKLEIIGTNNIYNFPLPQTINGSFEVYDDEEDIKILNIESNNDHWEMFCASGVYYENKSLSTITLKEGEYHIIKINDRKKIIFVTSETDEPFNSYKVNNENTYTIGKSPNSDISINCPYLLDNHLNLTYTNSGWIININENALVFANGNPIKSPNYKVENGTILYLYGTKIVLLSKYLMINNVNNTTKVKEEKLNTIKFPIQKIKYSQYGPIDVDRILYTDDEYFFKAPRLRRFIETYHLKIENPPPVANKGQDLPLLLVIGPMLGTGMYSVVNFLNAIIKISNGESTFKQQWTTIVIGITMLGTTLVWPNVTKAYQKKQAKKLEKERTEKYKNYINEKKQDIEREIKKQQEILTENLVDLEKCREIILTRGIQLWEKNINQQDFLTVRLGMGAIPLDIDVNWSESDFTFEENELKEEVDNLIKGTRILNNVPIGYSLLDNNITAIMNGGELKRDLLNNIILQLMTFHSYNDLKLVILTNKMNTKKYEYLKISPHCFSDNKEIRFYSNSNENTKEITNYLNKILNERIEKNGNDINLENCLPYYLIVTDCYDSIRDDRFINRLLSLENNYGFSLLILEDKLSKLPNECNNFISLNSATSTILNNRETSINKISFKNEIRNDIDMYNLTHKLANIPIKISSDEKALPKSITFLEMCRAGKVEQLNSRNRWKTNNPVISLKAEIGVNNLGENVYLDLHEKYHGPHGLIAGMTGSGKSEFIITYVLSMAINYSPEEVAFVLIDYKGGGLAGAFDNKGNGLRLPHLAGTITNLDKAEMNRSLASIESELRRRQNMFNDARNKLGESTVDIYKYQQFYREGKLDEPIPHLIIVCDEFAELKTQQPEFMENLISTARIGRSLGVHLILATQKPSGVVDAQIWSNTKFRVCLKVQDKSDSQEMLKRPDAAELKQVGRFYLQIGYNELFLLGQSGYAGAKYFPSDTTKKEVDNSLNVIDDIGRIIYSIDNNENKIQIEDKGEQLANALSYICEIAKEDNLYSKRLWLDPIPTNIYINNLIQKYNIKSTPYQITAICGEYDDPKNQVQNIFTLDLTNAGNTIIYGVNGSDKEMFLSTIIYSLSSLHRPEEINFYLIDFGSESLRTFNNLYQVGDMAFSNEIDKINNLFKLITEEINKRKKLFVEFGGQYTSYIKNSGKYLPLIVVMINEFDSFIEIDDEYNEILLKLSREGQRYGIVFIITANSTNIIRSKIKQNFSNLICLQMNSMDDYTSVFGRIKGLTIPEIAGRGIVQLEDTFEFQTATIYPQEQLITYINKFVEYQKQYKYPKAPSIPILPEEVNSELFKDRDIQLNKVPVGIVKSNLNVKYFDFDAEESIIISSNEEIYIKSFIIELVKILNRIKNHNTIIIDLDSLYKEEEKLFTHYYNDNLDTSIKVLIKLINQLNSNVLNKQYTCIITNIGKLDSKIDKKIVEVFTKEASKCENFNIIIASDPNDIKKVTFESWYRPINNGNLGIWIGDGVSDQNALKISSYTKELKEKISHEYGWYIKNGSTTLIKIINDGNVGDADE